VSGAPADLNVYVAGLELADSLGYPLAPSRGAVAAPPVDYVTAPQALAAGSQMIEFDASVEPAQRALITNAMLYAQLVANKYAGSGTAQAFYDKYFEVFSHIGGAQGSMTDSAQDFSGANADVHTAVIGVLQAALGPAATAASIINAALTSLSKIPPTTPWLNLFDTVSRHSSFSSFQLCYGSMAGAEPVLKMLWFAIDSTDTYGQVLFVKFSTSKASLRLRQGEVSPRLDTLQITAAQIAAAINQQALDYISDIKL
jgi:hypothetical protein